MKLYNCKQMMELLGVSRSTVRRYAEKGLIGCFQPAGRKGAIRYYLMEEDLNENNR